MKKAQKVDNVGKKYNLWQRALTSKREAFAKAYVMCNNKCQSYREAYNPKTTNEKAIMEEASRAFHAPGVGTRIAQLQRENMEERKIDLTWFIDEALQLYYRQKEGNRTSQQMKLLDMLAKNLGLNTLSTEDIAKIVLITPENSRVKKDLPEEKK